MAIESIGIIGAGPSGLAALYEFLHTNKDGSTSVGSTTKDPAFKKIVVFEQKVSPGGVWTNYNKESDPATPREISKVKYSLPDNITERESLNVSDDHTFEQPYVTEKTQDALPAWDKGATFSELFTNIPSNLTRFSYIPQKPEFNDKLRDIYPFLTLQEQVDRIQNFVHDEGLDKYIRYNSTVRNVQKVNGKWILEIKDESESGKTKWYKESFDALLVAWGHYSVPYYPDIPGFAEFVEKYPDVVSHVKSFRDSSGFENKDVLVIGGSISTVNTVENVFPVAKSLDISRKGPHPWFRFISVCLDDPRFGQKPQVVGYLPQTGEVEFSDGSKRKYGKIVLTTGYHNHFPNLEDYLPVVNPGSKSTVEGLYYNTFSIKDNSLGVIGILTTPLKFHSIEALAAALAGVWSGTKVLPSTEDQTAWLDALRESFPLHNLLHHTKVAEYFDDLSRFWPHGRKSPLESEPTHVEDIDYGYHKLVKIFNDKVNGK